MDEVPPDADYRIRRDAISLAIESMPNASSGSWAPVEARAARIEAYLRTGDFRIRH